MNQKLEKATQPKWILGDGAAVLESAGVSVPAVQALQLFAGPLADVEFPGASAELLEQHAVAVGDALKHAEEAQATLTAAQTKLEESVAALERAAEKGIAYARVYAEDDARVREALSGLATPKSRIAAPVERKRKVRVTKRSKKGDAALPEGADVEAEASESE